VVSSMEVIQGVVAPTLQVELPMALAMTCNSDSSVGEECQKVDLDTTVREDASSLDL
jgi:hypothetical protein